MHIVIEPEGVGSADPIEAAALRHLGELWLRSVTREAQRHDSGPVPSLPGPDGAVGAAAYVYTVVLAKAVKKTYPHVADAVRKLNGITVEVTLKPLANKQAFTAGQFLFVQCDGDPALAEPHPFTVSSAPTRTQLPVAVKASGDWMQFLCDYLRPGIPARVDGCCGMFNNKPGSKTSDVVTFHHDSSRQRQRERAAVLLHQKRELSLS